MEGSWLLHGLNIAYELATLGLTTLGLAVVFGLLGYLFMRLEMDPSPLMLGFILGPMLEENFRRSMLLSRGSFEVFVNRPISGTLLGLIAVFL